MIAKGLSRQILVAMAFVTVAAGLLVFFGTYLAFTILFYFSPWSDDTENWLTGFDFIILAILIFIALIVAAVAAIRLARRILEPLESLATSARRIKDGDLSARAVPAITPWARPRFWFRTSTPWPSAFRIWQPT